MPGSAPSDLPLPVAQLLRRARNAKSPKERHDNALNAWDVSVRLGVAAAPPVERGALVRGSLGEWVGALRPQSDASTITQSELLSTYSLFAEIATGKRATPNRLSPKKVVEFLPGYRNETLGHAAVRSPSFYDDGAKTLSAGLVRAWEAGVFLPLSSRLVCVDSIEVGRAGERVARLLDLTGLASSLIDPESSPSVPDRVLPRRVYLLHDGRFTMLHPLVIWDEEDLRERMLFFNGWGRVVKFLDFTGGESLRGEDLAAIQPTIEADLRGFFGGSAASSGPAVEEDSRDQTRFGEYRILGSLGEGGMGVVYLARQETLNRLVALKTLPREAWKNPVRLARFRREIALLSKCDDPSVVKIYASGEVDGTPYYSMEFIDGPDLDAVSRALSGAKDIDEALTRAVDTTRRARASLAEFLPPEPPKAGGPATRNAARSRDPHRRLAAVFRDAARAVQHLHDVGIIHRDIKPANLMMTSVDHRIVVMDLGLARARDSKDSIVQDRASILGTLRYMPPEQLQRNLLQVDHRADIYALGATLYEFLTQRPLFDGDSEERLREQVVREHPVPPDRINKGIPTDFATIVTKATEKDPADRYQTAEALAADLEAFIEGRPISARAHWPGYTLRLWAKRNPAFAVALVASLVLIIGSLGGALYAVNHSRLTFERMAILGEAAGLPSIADTLWPAYPNNMELMGRWLAKVKEVGIELDVSRGYFETIADPQQKEWIKKIISDWDKLFRDDPYGTTVASVKARLETAKSIQRESIDNHDQWQKAIRSIANIEECPKYRGQTIAPQTGLVPIGRNPASGLWEFCHTQTGGKPIVGSDGRVTLRDDSGLVFVLIPGGDFLMGSPTSEPDAKCFRQDEGPFGEKRVDSFFMSKFEMTRAQWRGITGRDPSYNAVGKSEAGRIVTWLEPVDSVSWDDCTLWLGRMGLELPTEEQWEYAARAGTETTWFAGPDLESVEGAANLCDETWSLNGLPRIAGNENWEDSFALGAPVGQFRPNPFGLHDTCGNVFEWCRNCFEKRSIGPAADLDPNCNDVVSRGGSYDFPAFHSRSAYRWHSSRCLRVQNHGVRPARELEK